MEFKPHDYQDPVKCGLSAKPKKQGRVIWSEKYLEKKFRDEVKKMGGEALKLTCPGHNGAFDRLTLMPHGTIWFVEFKTTGKKLSPLQVVFQKMVEKLGFRTAVVDDEVSLDKTLAVMYYESVAIYKPGGVQR